jgi:outer membrane protein
MKKILLLISSTILLFSVSIVFAADLKVGVLDVEKVLQSIPQVKKMQTQLKERFTPQQKQITKLQDQLKVDFDKFNREHDVMKDKDKKAMQNSILAQQEKLHNLQINFQQQLMEAQKKAMQSILNDIERAVDGIAADQKLNIVLTKANVAYNDSNMDITDQVIKVLK